MAKSPRAHELRVLVEWQRSTPGDDFTRKSDDWRTIKRLRIKAVSKSGREVVFSDHVEALNNYEIWCRYEADIHPEDRLVEVAGSRVWNIVGAQNFEERNRWTRIDAVQAWQNSLTS